MKTLLLRKSIGRSSLLIPLLFTCVLLSPSVKAGLCGTYPNICGPSATCVTEHENILGDLANFHDNTSAGCLALYNAETTFCDDPANGPCDTYYSGPVMLANTAFGSHALYNNDGGGDYNSAIGAYSLFSNTVADYNTAAGYAALHFNTDGAKNSATGSGALYNNTFGGQNTANGYQALYHNNGGANTATGADALYENTTGGNNVGLGYGAGLNLTTGSGNVCIGSGVLGVAGESNTTRIKNIYSSVASGRAVYINSTNKIGTLVSSRRFKDEIKPMDKASEAILALKPVTFRYKKEIEPNGAIMFGLIAEEVEKVDPDLVTRNEKGEAEAVRYDAVNAMLLNEFLKEHKKVENQTRKVQDQEATISQLKSTVAKQDATIAQQQKGMEAVTARLNEQAAQIQNVSAQLEASQAAPQVVNNP
jgi:hypothetical protein